MAWNKFSVVLTQNPSSCVPSRRKAKGQPTDSFFVIKKSQKTLSKFQIKNPKTKSTAPVPKSFEIVFFVAVGIRSAASDHLRIYATRAEVASTSNANTT